MTSGTQPFRAKSKCNEYVMINRLLGQTKLDDSNKREHKNDNVEKKNQLFEQVQEFLD